MDTAQFTANFYEKLAHRPYCSDDLRRGLIIRPKKTAIQMPYIQHNQPFSVTSLVFDIDRSDAYFAWSDANLPQPSWLAKNRINGHAHIGYMLSAPVCTSQRARQNVIQYLAKIEQAYSLALGADRGYAGLITKNPCHNTWETHISEVQPYELGYLADFVDLHELKTDLREISGLGRNCVMFDNVRHWAYKAIRGHLSMGFDSWHMEVLNVAINANSAFTSPLSFGEVKATAKSVARWVWRNHREAHAKFIERQSIKGKIGAAVANAKGACIEGGKARSQQYSDMRTEALKLHIAGKSIKEISEYLNVHRNSVSKWLKMHAQVPS